MADPGTIVAILIALAAPLLDLAEKAGVRRLAETTPVQSAAQKAAASFPEVEGATETLLDWTNHATFLELLDRLKAGEGTNVDDDVAITQHFLDASRFYYEADTVEKASTLVRTFLHLLERELYSSAEGVAILAARGEVQHAETGLALQEQGDRVVAEVVAGVLSAIEPGENRSEATLADEERRVVVQIDLARDLLRNAKSRSALDLLQEIEGTIKALQNVSEETHFRLALNLGTAHLNTGQPQEALRHYRRALEIRPTDSAALATAAKAHLAVGDAATAVELSERAVSEEPRNVAANGMRLLALHDAGRDEEVDRIVADSPWLAESSTGSAMLGELRLVQGRAGEAIPLLRAGLASSEVQLPLVHMLLAVALVGAVTSKPGTVEAPGEETAKSALREAVGFFDRAIEELQAVDDRATYLDTLASRGGVLAMLGEETRALEDLDNVLTEKPDHQLAVENKARLMILRRRPADSLELLERLPLPLGRDTSLFRAIALLRVDRPADALKVAKSLWDEDDTDVWQAQVADVLLAAEAMLGAEEATPRVIAHLETTWPHDPLALSVRADAAVRREDTYEALQLLQQAIEVASGRHARHLVHQAAGLRYDRQEFAQAVETYRQAGPPDDTDPRKAG
jgi:tetratricopeptide (TPR) repeat protein